MGPTHSWKKRAGKYIGVTAACIITAGVIWRILQPQEPVADAHPLSFWLAEYVQTENGGGVEGPARNAKAEMAIQKIGTNAIPWLMKMVRQQDGALKSHFYQLFMKQRIVRLSLKPSWAKNVEGERGFQILGPRAKEAVPNLIDIFEQPPSLAVQFSAAIALSGIGPSASAAIPSLLRGTTNSDANTRFSSVLALGSIRSDPKTEIPALIRCLSDTDIDVRSVAARSLGLYGAEARSAVPDLISAKGRIKGNVDEILKQIE